MQHLMLGLVALLTVAATEPPFPLESSQPSLSTPRGIAQGRSKAPSDAEIKRRIIEESIAAYDGPCACPYQRARNGSRCGRRSAYDRPGGEEPLCFASDVTAEMVAQYRAEHGLERAQQ
jgi:hypothetical protein